MIFKFLPAICAIFTVTIITVLFSVAKELHEDEKIEYCATYASLRGVHFVHAVYASIGVLIPLFVDHVLTLSTLWSADILLRIETYIFPVIFIFLQAFNIYFVSSTDNDTEYFWIYQSFVFYGLCIICNSVFVTQIDCVQKYGAAARKLIDGNTNNTASKRNKSLYVTIAAMFLFNLTLILKLIFAIYGLEWVYYVWCFVLFLHACCVGILLYSWYLKYQLTQKTGMKDQSIFYSFLELCLLTFLILSTQVYDIIMHDQTIFDSSTKRVVSFYVFTISCVYLFSEFYELKNKQLAKYSMDALETKRSFVRYVSHEIRTPLNAACLGLQLLDKELHKLKEFLRSYPPLVGSAAVAPMLGNGVDESILSVRSATSVSSYSPSMQYAPVIEIVADINQACNIAVEILNDLLMYEKIDGGLLVVEAQEVNLWPFIDEVIKMFSVQAKALELELIWHPLQEQKVLVMIDRYKMSQVIRNLVSNALKFSESGHKVIIRAEIIPVASRSQSMPGGLKSPNGSFLKFRPQSLPKLPVRQSAYRVTPTNPTTGISHEDQKVEAEEEKAGNHDLEQGDTHGHHLDQPVPLDSTNSLTSFVQTWVRRLSSTFPIPSLTAHSSATEKDGNLLQTLSTTFTDSYAQSHGPVDMIRISVTDCGPGISKENQKRLFHEIVQFDAAKLQQGKGSGIGLWVSNKIMKLHGGRIGVHSEGEGKGSTFYIDIPITKVIQIPATNALGSKSSHSKFTIGTVLYSIRQSISVPSSEDGNPQLHPDALGNNQSGYHANRRRSSSSTAASVANYFNHMIAGYTSDDHSGTTNDGTSSSIKNDSKGIENRRLMKMNSSSSLQSSIASVGLSRETSHTDLGGKFSSKAVGNNFDLMNTMNSDIGNDIPSHTMEHTFSVIKPEDLLQSVAMEADIKVAAVDTLIAPSPTINSNTGPSSTANYFAKPKFRKMVSFKEEEDINSFHFFQRHDHEIPEMIASSQQESAGMKIIRKEKEKEKLLLANSNNSTTPSTPSTMNEKTAHGGDNNLITVEAITPAPRPAPVVAPTPAPSAASMITGFLAKQLSFTAVSSTHDTINSKNDFAAGRATQPIKPIPTKPMRRALVIDDSGVNRRMLRKFCLSYFDVVDEAIHGVDAINKFESHQRESEQQNYYDVIFTDYYMPQMDGLEVITRLRGEYHYTGKLIGLTGNTDSTMEHAFISAGANMVLIKPIQGHDLQTIVQSL